MNKQQTLVEKQHKG